MRRFRRPPVICANCRSAIYWLSSCPDGQTGTYLLKEAFEPPPAIDTCPGCGGEIDTTAAYPVLPNFPPSFAALRTAWRDFRPQFELHRATPEETLNEINLSDLERMLNAQDGHEWLKQRLFYRSCVSFYRSIELFFAHFTLGGHNYKTWADVTAYYSRFYFIQAFLNLLLTSFIRPADKDVLLFFDGQQIRAMQSQSLPVIMRNTGPHERWWLLMEAIKVPTDYSVGQLEFVLSRSYYDPQQRNTVNYGFSWLDGFPELEWFDVDVRGMMSHFGLSSRGDRDITDIDRFFGEQPPEGCDQSDFAADEAQVLWLSIRAYLELLHALEIPQTFITPEKIAALSEIHLVKEFPNLIYGVLTEARNILGTDFEVQRFLQATHDRQPGYTFWR